jgi:hypothetical protein
MPKLQKVLPKFQDHKIKNWIKKKKKKTTHDSFFQ